MSKVIILDDMAYIRYRIRDTLENMGLDVCESNNSFDFFNKLSDNKDDISLIILEVGLGSEDGFEVLKKIKARELNIPVMVLTKLNTRDAFIRCIKEGTSEYILKPFNNKVLTERIRKLVKACNTNSDCGEIKYLNFQQYITKQIERSKIENTRLSVMMSSLVKLNVKKTDEKIEVKDSYLILMDVLYEKLKQFFKTPDLFEKYGLSTFIAVLPKCSTNMAKYRISNIEVLYDNIKSQDSNYSQYHLVSESVTFPEDGLNKDELLNKLAVKIKNKINE